MNTAQKKKNQLFMLKNASQDRRIFDAGQKDGIWKSFNLIFWALHVKFGFGEKRLCDLQEYVKFILDCEDVSVKDIAEALKDECNIVFAEDK